MTKKIERLAIVLLILWVISLIPNPLMTIFAARLYGHQEFVQFQFLRSALVSFQLIVQTAVHIGVGVWLFLEAKKETKTPWIWLLLGMVFGLLAVAIFLLIQIRDEMRFQKEE